jgi:hypothetical protein
MGFGFLLVKDVAPWTFFGGNPGREFAMRSLLALIVLLGGLVPCQAQNLLPNPEFDHNVSGWTPPPLVYPNALSWDSSQSAFGLGGSALLSTSFGVGGDLSASACVPVTPGVTYSFGGQYRFPTTFGGHAFQLSMIFTSDPSCTTGALLGASSSLQYAAQNPPGQWQTLAGPDTTAPPGAVKALFIASLESVIDSQSHAVNVDDVYLGPQGTVGPRQAEEIPALTLPGLFGLALGLSFAAFWVLSKNAAKRFS